MALTQADLELVKLAAKSGAHEAVDAAIREHEAACYRLREARQEIQDQRGQRDQANAKADRWRLIAMVAVSAAAAGGGVGSVLTMVVNAVKAGGG